ncbi:hypothetical protein A3J33_03630 [candidate division WWE3 bacterium RIFCSPLOWO2_02_FULL_53_10]|nr:MAG: hypothetical protein A3J33_03630 [candidate division WWE3 bacterium RIFCSPLOWO2_02_FULL_53_10]
MVVRFFFASREYRALGFNMETLMNLMINFLTLVATYGVLKQGMRVWEKRSPAGLSGITFSYLFFYCLAFIIYAVEKCAFNMVISSLIAFAYIPMIVGLWRFGDGRERRNIAFSSVIMTAMPVIMAKLHTIDSKEAFLGILLVGMFGVFVVGLEKFRRTPGIGSGDPAFSWAFLITGLFWIPYSYKLDAMELVLFNVGMVTVMGTTLFLYYVRKHKLMGT